MPPTNVLFVPTGRRQFDALAALGADPALTPELDRLVRRGAARTDACPPCLCSSRR